MKQHNVCVCCLNESNQLSLHGRCPKCIRLPKCSKHGLLAQRVEHRIETPKAVVSKAT